MRLSRSAPSRVVGGLKWGAIHHVVKREFSPGGCRDNLFPRAATRGGDERPAQEGTKDQYHCSSAPARAPAQERRAIPTSHRRPAENREFNDVAIRPVSSSSWPSMRRYRAPSSTRPIPDAIANIPPTAAERSGVGRDRGGQIAAGTSLADTPDSRRRFQTTRIAPARRTEEHAIAINTTRSSKMPMPEDEQIADAAPCGAGRHWRDLPEDRSERRSGLETAVSDAKRLRRRSSPARGTHSDLRK